MNEQIIHGNVMADRQSAHEELARALGFPAWYGRNLDALWDMLTTIDVFAVLAEKDAMLEQLGDYGRNLLDTLLEAAEENPRFRFRIAD